MICRKTEIIVKEGWKYLGFLSVLFVLSLFTDFVFLELILFFFMVVIIIVFRNPERIPQEIDKLSCLSPIDGRIDYIGKVFEDRYFEKDMLLVSIRSSICDVSIQRNPFDLDIKKVYYKHGLNIDIKSPKAKLLNEQIDIIASSFKGDILIRSIIGRCAKRIYTICDNLNSVKKGDRYLIMTEGKVELYLPLDCRIRVVFGEKVKAGESILGYFKD